MELARERRISKAGALRWALDIFLETWNAEAEQRAVILGTAGIAPDYPDWPEWQRCVRGRAAAKRLCETS